MRLGLFVLLTGCSIVVFALTMTFVPLMPAWSNHVARAGLLVAFGALWWAARGQSPLGRFRPVFFAGLASVTGLSLGFYLGDWGLGHMGLTTTTPVGIAMAKFWQALLTVVGILVVAKLCGEDFASLYIRKGRLLAGLGVGLATGAVCLLLALQQPGIKALGTARLLSIAPWALLFVLANGLMEELLFRGLFLGRYERLLGSWPAVLATALAFTLAHLQVTYAPDRVTFLLVTFGFAILWGWLMQKTRSLWGSALFHAGADLLIILPIFSSLRAV